MDKKALNRTAGFLTLQTKIALAFVIFAILSAGLVTVVVYFRVRSLLYQDVRTRLRDAVAISALQVDGDEHALLTDPAQQSSDRYQALQRTFREIRDTGSDFLYVYSFRSNGDQVYFVVDADDDPVPLGEVYTELEAGMAQVLATLKEPTVDEEFTTDEYGTVLTGYAPILKSDGTLDAVLGIDIAASDIIAYQNNLMWVMLLILLITTLIMGVAGWFLGRQLTSPILSLIEGARRVASGELNYKVQVNARDETSALAESFNSMSTQLDDLVGRLEKRVAERTREVENRSNYLSASVEVSRVATSILEPDELIRRVVDLIRDSFKLYYVGLFLLDEDRGYAVLRAGTGEAGQQLVERGHKIKVGEGMIGWCISNTQARIAMEAGEDTVRLATPILPATRSEAALPLRSRGQVIGALTVQSDQPGAFDDATVAVLQMMVDQIGIALDNARLFVESEESLKNLRRSITAIDRQTWHAVLQERSVLGYRGNASGVNPIGCDESSSKEGAIEYEDYDQSRIQIPLKVRSQVVGIVEAQKPRADDVWSKDEIDLMNTLVDQLGVAIENARLYEESQKIAQRERVLAEITGRVRSSTDINAILQTAVQELVNTLQVPKGSIRLIRPDTYKQGGESIEKKVAPSGNGGQSHE